MQTYKDYKIVEQSGYYWIKNKGCKKGVVKEIVMPDMDDYLDQEAEYSGPIVEPIDEKGLWPDASGM